MRTLSINLRQVILFLAFAVWLPWQKGTAFLDPTILGAYACLGVVFAAPDAAVGISVFRAVRMGLILSWAMLLGGVAMVYLTRFVVVGPDLVGLAETGLFGLAISAATSAAVSFTALKTSSGTAKILARLLLLGLLVLFYYWSGWITDIVWPGTAICAGIAAVFLFLLHKAGR